MLFDTNDERVNRNPHREEFNVWIARISDADFQAIEQAINVFCDDHPEFRSSFMPGQAPAIRALFLALTSACDGDEERAGLFFGNIVWRVVDDRTDDWYFNRPDRDDDHPLGTFYWRR